MKKTVLVFALGLLLTGCGKSPFDTSSDMATLDHNLQSATIVGCREWITQKDTNELIQYNSLKPEDKTFALMHRETMQMIAYTFGSQPVDPCKPGTNVWDAYITYIKEVNETGRLGISTTGAVVKHGITLGAAVWAASELGDIANDSNKTTVQGDYSYIGGNSTNSTTTVTTLP